MRTLFRQLASGLLCALSLFSASAQAQNTSLRLGQSLPLSGPLAELGNEYREGILAFFNQINAKGGVHGKKIELITLDDAYVVDRTVENTKKLIEKEGVLPLWACLARPITARSCP